MKFKNKQVVLPVYTSLSDLMSSNDCDKTPLTYTSWMKVPDNGRKRSDKDNVDS